MKAKEEDSLNNKEGIIKKKRNVKIITKFLNQIVTNSLFLSKIIDFTR